MHSVSSAKGIDFLKDISGQTVALFEPVITFYPEYYLFKFTRFKGSYHLDKGSLVCILT